MGYFSRENEKDNFYITREEESPTRKFRTSMANKANIDEEYKKRQQKYNIKVKKPITVENDKNSNEQDNERY